MAFSDASVDRSAHVQNDAKRAARKNEFHQPVQRDLGRPDCAAKIYRFHRRPNQPHNSARLTQLRDARDRHERAVRCDGREACADVARVKRTAKSCGSGAAVLALSPREAKLLEGDGGKRAVLREEHEVSRKAIAQGRPECSRCPVCSCAVLFAQIARETAGAASTRSSLRPLTRGREVTKQTSGAMRRESANLYPHHCEERKS